MRIITLTNVIAPEGAVYVCSACGKRSRDKYGNQAIDREWDESCSLNSILCEEASLVLGKNGRVNTSTPWIIDI